MFTRQSTPPRPRSAARLVDASVSANTRRAYIGVLRRLDTWLDGRVLDDANLAAYVAELHDAGRALSSAWMAVAEACFPAKLAGSAESVRRMGTARALAGYRRIAADRGRGQAGWPRSAPPTSRPCSLRATARAGAGVASVSFTASFSSQGRSGRHM